MSTATLDRYARTDVAVRNRRAKAAALAQFAYRQGWTPSDLAEAGRSPDTRRWVEREAATRPCSDATWGTAIDLLNERLAWDATHPDDPRVRRTP